MVEEGSKTESRIATRGLDNVSLSNTVIIPSLRWQNVHDETPTCCLDYPKPTPGLPDLIVFPLFLHRSERGSGFPPVGMMGRGVRDYGG